MTFDRYFGSKYIKEATRVKRKGKRRPIIMKLITSPNVPLPQVWEQYITHDDNKADMAEFLLNELLNRSENLPAGSTIVVGGGFPGDVYLKSSTFDVTNLCVNHWEADTRMIFHSMDAIDRGDKR